MEKRVSRIGYLYKGSRIELSDNYIYEVSVYKHEKNRYSIQDSKCFKSDKFLNIKEAIYKYFKNYYFVKYIILIAAPIEFIEENNLQLIIPKVK